MTISEKRHFSVFAGRYVQGEANKYLSLFEAIQAHAEGDLEQHLGPDYPLERLAYNLHHLAYLQLRALESYRHESSMLSKLRSRLNHAEILAERLMFEQADKELRKLIKHAGKFEVFPILLNALDNRRQLLKRIGGKRLFEDLPQIHQRYKEVLEFLTNEHEILEIYDQVFMRTQKGQQLTSEAFNPDQVLADARLQDAAFPKGFSAKLGWLFIHAFLHTLARRHQEAAHYFHKVTELWRANPHQIELAPDRYAMALVDVLNSGYRLDDYSKFGAYLAEIRSLEGLPRALRMRVSWIASNLEVIWYMNTLQFNAASEVVQEWENILDAYSYMLDDASKLSYAYNICVLHFIKEDFSGALRWLNRILNHPKTHARQDIQRFARILNLILNWDLGIISPLGQEVNAARRQMIQVAALADFEKRMLRLFSDLLRLPESARRSLFLDAELEVGSFLQSGAQALGMTETWVWLKSKVGGKPMAELL